jgi:AmiR/NasT family two-component response regulator
MKPVTVVVAVPDPIASDTLTASLRSHFRVVLPVAGFVETRPAILKHRADVVVVDLESTSVGEIAVLLQEFPALSLVCIHRLADDRLWSAVLAAGALDCCHPSDIRGIVLAVTRQGRIAQGHAA